jgi:protein-tyrosine phosphatase
VAQQYAVLMVCMGNICRSPTAEGVFRHLVEQAGLQDRVRIDSAGTLDYHAGSPPDHRSSHHASLRGYDLSALRARQVQPLDFARFDLILAMDRENLEWLLQQVRSSLQT